MLRYSLPSSSKPKNFPTKHRISLPCKLEHAKFQIEEAPVVLLHREMKIDPCYIPSKISLGCTMTRKDDLLADLELFDRLTVSPYNSGDWELILTGNQAQPVEKERIFASIHSGLPRHLRTKIWLYLANVETSKTKAFSQGVTYKDLVIQPCAVQDDIEKDVVRSFGNLRFFQENNRERLGNLQNILLAYANFDKGVGYTQGLNFVAGSLFYFLASKKSTLKEIEECEEKAFWMLVYIMQEKQWRGLYTPQTPKLIELIADLENQLKKKLPKVYTHLKNTECIAACFSQFFMTLMLYNTPEEFAMRVLEFFLIAGTEAIMHIIIKLLSTAQHDILRRNRIEELWPFIKSEMIANTTNRYQNVFSKFLNNQPSQLPLCILRL